MKIRNSFVTNSSSSSFCIYNKSQNPLTLKDLMEDWKNCIKDYYEEEFQLHAYYKNEKWGKDFLEKYSTFEEFYNQVLEDADELYSDRIDPREGIVLECGDHPTEDGYASLFIHSEDCIFPKDPPHSDNFEIKFLESFH